MIQKSIQLNQTMSMIYLSKDRSITKRRVKPLKLDGGTLIAFCFVRWSVRKFRLDHVLAIMPQKRHHRLKPSH